MMNSICTHRKVGQKSDALFNYVIIMPCKLQAYIYTGWTYSLRAMWSYLERKLASRKY